MLAVIRFAGHLAPAALKNVCLEWKCWIGVKLKYLAAGGGVGNVKYTLDANVQGESSQIVNAVLEFK